ncbi:oxidoreductase [Pseudoroseomonas aestuarii]|uniref:Oxidoreductase n=2 Tax=Teichococcus aestuarii TaxID=568898 RepID=A0A2U1V0K4_9PROT|nr:oxidoreductase [Pseudoroseomonas aestuarii]
MGATPKGEIMLRREALFLAPGLLVPGLRLAGSGCAQAQAAAPDGAVESRVILSVSGRVAPAEGGAHPFSLSRLEALGLVALRTETPWTQGPQNFSGVPLERLLAAVQAGGETLRCTAINRYQIVVPREDGARHGAVLATRLDGEPMRVRDRGPVWLVYPWSERPALQRPLFYERSIWQLRSIEAV